MDAIGQIKKLAPFLDPHLLLFILKANIGSESDPLQNQIKSKLINADQNKANTIEAEAKEKANKLITLLSNNKDVTQMRKDG